MLSHWLSDKWSLMCIFSARHFTQGSKCYSGCLTAGGGGLGLGLCFLISSLTPASSALFRALRQVHDLQELHHHPPDIYVS